MNKNFVFRIGECIFDLTLVAYDIIEKYNLDVDSRAVYNKVFDLAIEFEGIFDEDAMDYMTEIEEFGYKRLKEYFDIDTTYELSPYDVTISYSKEKTVRVYAMDQSEAVDVAVQKLGVENPISYLVENEYGKVVNDGCF